jgi:hypothetical protein
LSDRPLYLPRSVRAPSGRLTATAGCLLWLGIGGLSERAYADAAQGGPAASNKNAVLTDYSPLSRSPEIVRRMLTPWDALRVMQESAREGKGLREQAIDLPNERFAFYVPAHAPRQAYSLLVFVPPWDTATVPPEWISTLDSHEMIFVSAANSGNGANVLDRREPLALLALQNIVNRYPVDPQRVYIGGFSGGSRVALRLALGYPDVFHGALLMAGSDPIGSAQLPLPVEQLFRQFQESVRMAYATGERDEFHLHEDLLSQQSLREWCVFDPATVSIPWRGHELPDSSDFARALDALLKDPKPDARKLAECRSHIDRELNSELSQVEEAAAGGRVDRARRLLEKIDARYGGLAAPRSIELVHRLSELR